MAFVVQRPGSLHAEIDAAELARVFANESLPDTMRSNVIGPWDVHLLNTLRRRHGVGAHGAVPADVFLWATGEPPHRETTKLGGVPYLPASMRWPQRDGTTGDFYAQLCFADSRDLVPPLPSDVLLVFRFHDLEHTSWDEDLYEFVWVDLGDHDLIRTEDVRHSRNGARTPWPTMHGYRVRTFDAPNEDERLRVHELAVVTATKIGGAPSDRQSARGPENIPSDWRFLGQIAATWPATNAPYAVVNRAAPVPPPPRSPDYGATTSGPGDGITCLYLDADDRVRVHFSCA